MEHTTTDRTDRTGSGPAPAGAGSTSPARPPRVTDEMKAACRTGDALIRSLGIVGRLGENGAAICPVCNETARIPKELKVFDDGGFKHYKNGCHATKETDAVGLLTGPPLQLPFLDAVRVLNGAPTSVPVHVPEHLPTIQVSAFKATWDPEVYAGVLAYGRKAFNGAGVTAAQEFYAQWHIDPEVVRASGAVYITDPDHFADAIVKKFGVDRLIACGIFVKTTDPRTGEERPMCLIGKKWPVVEPARNADGRVVNLQFRASNAQYEKYLAHKAGKLPYSGNQKFLNIKGNLPGMVNLDGIAQLPEGTQVFCVEGFKDRLAAATMGTHAFGIPGVDYRPSEAELEVLRRLRVVLSLDGDEGGERGVNGLTRKEKDGSVTVLKQGLKGWLTERGVETHVHPLTDGMDITDRLVEKHARAGCPCRACQKMRDRLTRAAATAG